MERLVGWQFALGLVRVVCLAALATSPAAIAEQGGAELAPGAEPTWGGSLALVTDYMLRGISQTRGQSAVQGGVHVQSASGWHAGAWASTINRNRGPGATFEIDLHATRSWSFGENWSARIGLTHYYYPNDLPALRYDYDEVTASLTWQSVITAVISWSPNTSRYGDGRAVHDRKALSYELTVLQPLPHAMSIAAGAGYYDLSNLFGTGYWYWNAGLVYSLGNVQIDVSRIGSDATAEHLFGYRAAEPRWSAALLWRF